MSEFLTPIDCVDCDGKGEFLVEYGSSYDFEPVEQTEKCDTCSGTGTIWLEDLKTPKEILNNGFKQMNSSKIINVEFFEKDFQKVQRLRRHWQIKENSTAVQLIVNRFNLDYLDAVEDFLDTVEMWREACPAEVTDALKDLVDIKSRT